MMRAEIFRPGLLFLASRLELSITGKAVPDGICCAKNGVTDTTDRIAQAEISRIHFMPHHLPTRCQRGLERLADTVASPRKWAARLRGPPDCSQAALN